MPAAFVRGWAAPHPDQQLIDREPAEQPVASFLVVSSSALGEHRVAQGARRTELLDERLPPASPDLRIGQTYGAHQCHSTTWALPQGVLRLTAGGSSEPHLNQPAAQRAIRFFGAPQEGCD